MKKIKNGAKKPPLSLLDIVIYVIFILIGAAVLPLLYLELGLRIPFSIAFADDTVVASDNFFAVICAAPISILLSGMIGFTSARGIDNKQPIFGSKRFKPSGLKPVIKTYPIFSKEFRDNLSNGTKRKIKRTSATLIVLIIIFSLIYSLGIYPRTVLDKNDNIITYNAFNKETHRCSVTDADKLVIDIVYNIHYRSEDSWGIRLKFSCADKIHEFNPGHFYGMNAEETLRYMLYLKSLMYDRYEITNEYRIDDLIRYREYGSQETRLVYELFDHNVS